MLHFPFVFDGIKCMPLVTEMPSSSSKPQSESSDFDSVSHPPAILITAPSQDDIYASSSNFTIADAVKEQRPPSAPIVVGKKFMKRK